MNKSQLVDYYIDKSQHPDFQLNEVRKDLQVKNIPEEDIKVIVRLVDNEVQKRALTQSSSKKGNEIMIAGGVLTFIGAGITIGTYTGIINMGNSFLIVYGPFFTGISMLFTGLAKK
ncbi:hypothetical protein [Sediminitomix flava]|uniref:Uncharacterized protein n=1 Tax=Sediminitomix flava TaxID=379075 RepID=A0A315YW87_SEDFL|nr:hypothetical protein [Sediminitomix flava]PWJ33505.1 hypothetical protein BC781_1137 [Sediminitomix flava]